MKSIFLNRSLIIVVSFFLFSFLSSFRPNIVIRHDRKDRDYQALGNKFPSVCKVGEHTGDGTLIGAKWIITAAHVAQGVMEREGKDFRIYFQGEPKGYQVAAVYIYPNFQPMGNHDIALIELKESIRNIAPSSIYRKQDEKGKDIFIAGHGDFKNGKEKQWVTDGKKRAATNRIDDVSDDHILFKFDAPGSANCTELEGTAGRGDSGGPAYIMDGKKYFLAGISSAGTPGENGPGTYGAVEHYTRVSMHLNWIDEVLSGKVAAYNKDSETRMKLESGSQEPTVLEGLGLFLSQGKNRIDIEGKIDQEVPKEFRDVIFGASSFVVSLNGKKYESLKMFIKDFKSLIDGQKFEIVFSVNGQEKQFETVR